MVYTKRVVFLCKMLPHYRRPFFEKLRSRLAEIGIEVQVIYGQGREADQKKQDLVDLSWGKFVPNNTIPFCNKELIWQPVLGDALKADLIIVEQANSLLVNYCLQILQTFGAAKMAFWGHGKNFQAQPSDRFSEHLKRFVATKVWWWFAYTESTKVIVSELGFPPGRITVVQNAIDTIELLKLSEATTEEDCREFRQKLEVSDNTCVYCGGLYKEKRLEFLVEAACSIHQAIPDFNLLIIGSGPDREFVVEAARKYSWIKYLGPLFGAEKVKAYRASKLALMPGLVGLVILDSFALQVPLITTNVSFHSPEIAYLENEVNGIMTTDCVTDFAARVVELLTNNEELAKLRHGAKEAQSKYTLEVMVENFARGISESLCVE
ncbi:MAG: glycosyltransferase family 4 protein [Candidatus Obscuribacterales bacterium]|nr:glycosyltransferase family 4 protein [Candidatus Obscuribacterales bacterium]